MCSVTWAEAMMRDATCKTKGVLRGYGGGH